MCDWTRYTIVSDVVLAIVINTSASLLGGVPLTFVSWYPFTCAAFGTNVVLQLLLPVHGWARALSRWCAGRRWSLLVEVFFENLVFVTCISLMMALLGTGGAGLLAAWWHTYVPLVLVGYVASVILCLVGRRLEPRA